MENDARKAKAGDTEAFARLIKSMEGMLYRVSSSILRSEQDKLDAAQETIMKAYVSLSTLNEPRYFKTWIIRILLRECTRIARKRNKVVPMDNLAEPEDRNRFEQQIELREAIDSLEEEYRTVIHLHYIEDLSIKEISDILEIQEGTVKSRLSRARKRLLDFLQEHEPAGGIANERI